MDRSRGDRTGTPARKTDAGGTRSLSCARLSRPDWDLFDREHRGVRPPRNPAKFGFGEWHRAELIADGDRFEVRIDGVEKQNVDLASDAELQYRLKRGFIGFVDAGYKWWIRAVEIEELPERRKYIGLFDGSTLNGWSRRRGGIWTARDGILTGANGDGTCMLQASSGMSSLAALVRAPGKGEQRRVLSRIRPRGQDPGARDPDLRSARRRISDRKRIQRRTRTAGSSDRRSVVLHAGDCSRKVMHRAHRWATP